jgi:DNA-binding NarL/FixJ family response regulator
METLGDQTWPLRVIDDILILSDPPVVLIAGTNLESSIVKYLIKPNFGGFLLKREVAYSIASAVALTYQGNVVITPGVSNIAVCKESTRPVVIVDGSHKVANFSRRESEIIHLGILFNLSQRDLADELLIGTDWISETMSNVYEKLGLREILNGEVPLNLYFEDEVVITHFERILERAKKSSKTGKFRKAPWMSTLAFHLLTVPEIDKF